MILTFFFYSLLVFVEVIFVIWILANSCLHMLRTETFSLKKLEQKKILVIFAHPDDEAISCSGTLAQLSQISEIKMIVLTKGERGQEGMKMNERLKGIRTQELKNSLNIMNIKDFNQFDIGDTQLENKTTEVKDLIQKEIETFLPDLIITHDPSGLYGHPDHIMISHIVTDLQKLYSYKIWYITLPERVLRVLNMKNETSIEKDISFSIPNIRTFTLFQLLKKICIVYGYKSQRLSFVKVFPLKFIPLWFYISLTPFEYFQEKKKSDNW